MAENKMSIGGLWVNTFIKDGKEIKYLSGEIKLNPDDEKVRLVIFKNDRKEGRQPDYRIFLSDPTEAPKERTPEVDEEPF